MVVIHHIWWWQSRYWDASYISFEMYRYLIQQGSTIVQYTLKYTSTPLTLAPEFLRQYEIKFNFFYGNKVWLTLLRPKYVMVINAKNWLK